MAKERVIQSDLHLAQSQRDIESEILYLYTLIEEYLNILDTNLNQIIIAEQKAAAEDTLYKQGRSSLDLLIQAQDNVLNSKLSYSNLSATYQKHVLRYKALIDELLTEYGIQL